MKIFLINLCRPCRIEQQCCLKQQAPTYDAKNSLTLLVPKAISLKIVVACAHLRNAHFCVNLRTILVRKSIHENSVRRFLTSVSACNLRAT